jgi:hypothetical protein
MRPETLKKLSAAHVALFLLLLALGTSAVLGDEPVRLGRLFRFGAAPASPAAATQPPADPESEGPTTPNPRNPTPSILSPLAATPAQPRLVPQPRVSRAVTDADPVVTRVSLGRSDDGTQFGMFLQVFADGTVIDSDGVHRVGREGIKDVLATLEQSDFYRVKGHCGGPPTDFVEQVHMVVFERSLGRLRANAFSFSGNTQGCDHAVRHLQTTLDALQAKLSRPASTPAAPGGATPTTPTSPPIRLNGGVTSDEH